MRRAQLILHIQTQGRLGGSGPPRRAPTVSLSACSRSRHVKFLILCRISWQITFTELRDSLLWPAMERVRATVSVSHLPLRVFFRRRMHVYVPYQLGKGRRRGGHGLGPLLGRIPQQSSLAAVMRYGRVSVREVKQIFPSAAGARDSFEGWRKAWGKIVSVGGLSVGVFHGVLLR